MPVGGGAGACGRAPAVPQGGGAVSPLPEGAHALPGGRVRGVLPRPAVVPVHRHVVLAARRAAGPPRLAGQDIHAPRRVRRRRASPGKPPGAVPRGAPLPCGRRAVLRFTGQRKPVHRARPRAVHRVAFPRPRGSDVAGRVFTRGGTVLQAQPRQRPPAEEPPGDARLPAGAARRPRRGHPRAAPADTRAEVPRRGSPLGVVQLPVLAGASRGRLRGGGRQGDRAEQEPEDPAGAREQDRCARASAARSSGATGGTA